PSAALCGLACGHRSVLLAIKEQGRLVHPSSLSCCCGVIWNHQLATAEQAAHGSNVYSHALAAWVRRTSFCDSRSCGSLPAVISRVILRACRGGLVWLSGVCRRRAHDSERKAASVDPGNSRACSVRVDHKLGLCVDHPAGLRALQTGGPTLQDDSGSRVG